MAFRVKLKKKWKNEFGKEYPVNTILQLIPGKAIELIDGGIAEKYDGEYPPKQKVKMSLSQLNKYNYGS